MIDNKRDDLDYLPCDCEPSLEQPDERAIVPTITTNCTAPRLLYTINSNRSRYQIVADYAARHDLSARQVDELVRQLPDYGVKSMLAGSVAALRRGADIICMADERKKRHA